MKCRFLLVVVIFCFMSRFVYAQIEFSGKWQADQGGRGGSSPAIVLDLKVDGNKLSGTISGIGTGESTTISEGTITGKTFTCKIVRRFDGGLMAIEIWNGEMKDDNTISLAQPAGGGTPGTRRGSPPDPGVGPAPAAPPPSLGAARGTDGRIIFHRAQ